MRRAGSGEWWAHLVAPDKARTLFVLLRDLQAFTSHRTTPKEYVEMLAQKEWISAVLWALGVGDSPPDAAMAARLVREGILTEEARASLPYDLDHELQDEADDVRAYALEAANEAGTDRESE